MRRSGWTVTSLAKESRFSRVQIDRVKNGRHPGSHRLHRTLVAILGKEYAEALPFLPDW